MPRVVLYLVLTKFDSISGRGTISIQVVKLLISAYTPDLTIHSSAIHDGSQFAPAKNSVCINDRPLKRVKLPCLCAGKAADNRKQSKTCDKSTLDIGTCQPKTATRDVLHV